MNVSETVTVALSEIVERDFEEFLDFLDHLTTLTETIVDVEEIEWYVGPLQETDYQIVGLGDEPNTVMLRVTGHRDLTTL